MTRHNLQAIGNFRLKGDGLIWEACFRQGNTLRSDGITEQLVITDIPEFLFRPCVRTVEEHQHHTVQVHSVVLHRSGDGLGDGLAFFLRQCLPAVQHLRKALDDVQRRTDLMRHVLDKLSLLSDSLPGHLHRMHQLFVALLRLLSSLTDTVHMFHKCLCHCGEAVLKLSHGVLALSMGYHLVIPPFGNLLRAGVECTERTDGVVHRNATEPEDHQQPDDDKGDGKIGQMATARQDVIIRTDQGQCPGSAWHRTMTHVVRLTVDVQMHRTFPTSRLLTAQV